MHEHTKNKEEKITADFSIHGIGLRFNTNSQTILSSFKEFLGCFSATEPGYSPDITFTIFDNRQNLSHDFSIPEGLSLLCAPQEFAGVPMGNTGLEKLDFYGTGGESTYYLDMGNPGLISFDLTGCRVEGYIQNSDLLYSTRLPGAILMVVLSEIIKTLGYFQLHCSAVDRNGKGVLLPGFSGSGKTTTCIALIRNGYRSLGDDCPMLRYNMKGSLELLAFPERVNVTEKTINFFPELKNSNLLKDNGNGRKWSFNTEDVYPGSTKMSTIPKVVLFPEVHSGQKSRLESLSGNEAFKLLLPHGLMVLDKETARKHFDILVDLIESVECYRLYIGSDFRELDKLIDSIL